MPSAKGRSRSASRSRSKGRTSKSRSRSRSRSRGRTPTRATSKRTAKSTPTRSKKPIALKPSDPSETPTRKPSTPARPSMSGTTPTRMSARLAEKGDKVDYSQSSVKKIPSTSESSESVTGKSKSAANHAEFGGPIGTFFMIFLLPATVYYINLMCNKERCDVRKLPEISRDWRAYLDLEAACIFLGWFLFQAILYMLPVGEVVQGQAIVSQGNKRLKYRCNGFFALVVSLAVFAGAVYLRLPVTIVYDKFLQLITAALIFSFVLGVALYVKARMGPSNKLAPGGKTGNIVYDFFMGHELNPRIGEFDFKYFCEMRPGLIGWVIINLCFVVKQYQDTGSVDCQLALVAFFQAWYVADALWFEDAILTTMDIVFEGFGFMLAFGDLVWVPFLYCLQGRFLLEHPHPLAWYCIVPVVILNFVGYYIFRGSNSQKNEFRKNPHNPALAHLETIPTRSSKRLLVSGWWGLCRKPNYLGDLIMALSWSLMCGFDSIVPYFYPIYFLILLVHRERRDDAICQRKYKDSWTRYCERVKYRIFPGIY